MADKKKIGDDLMSDLKKAFSTKNDILQYLMGQDLLGHARTTSHR